MQLETQLGKYMLITLMNNLAIGHLRNLNCTSLSLHLIVKLGLDMKNKAGPFSVTGLRQPSEFYNMLAFLKSARKIFFIVLTDAVRVGQKNKSCSKLFSKYLM